MLGQCGVCGILLYAAGLQVLQDILKLSFPTQFPWEALLCRHLQSLVRGCILDQARMVMHTAAEHAWGHSFPGSTPDPHLVLLLEIGHSKLTNEAMRSPGLSFLSVS